MNGEPPWTPFANAPLIVTAELAEPWQGHFQALRDRHFPSHRNIVPAHITLFHALPGEDPADAGRQIAHAVRRQNACPLTIGMPFGLGFGVAFKVNSPALATVRAAIADGFAGRLTQQDDRPYRPHITIQNKETPEQARQTLAQVAEGFSEIATSVAALHLWRYENGPWRRLHSAPFGAVDPVS